MGRKHIFQQSKNWWINKDLAWLIKNAEYVFNHSYHNGSRPHIKTKLTVDGCDVFELGNDAYGILLKGYFTLNDHMIKAMNEKTENVEEFLVDYFNASGDKGFVNPKNIFWKKLFYKNIKFV